MGADYRAIAVIGVSVDPSRLFKEERGRGCPHPTTEATYCGDCGKRTWIQSTKPLFDERNSTLGVLDVVFGTDRESAVIGFSCATGYGDGAPVLHRFISSINEMMATIRRQLEPLGLWDESQFGLWSILYCSY